MTRGAESILRRWSRRKLAARQPDPATPDRAQEAVPAARLPQPFPRLEDLTAEGDLGVFLQEGVPDALRNAALRKMWSLDPAIRDHVGLAECAWDFNRPESIPGFGPLATAAAPAFLSRWTAAAPAAPDAAPSPIRRPESEAKSADARAPAEESEAAPSVQEGAAIDGEAGFELAAADLPATARRMAAGRHGSALPRPRVGR